MAPVSASFKSPSFSLHSRSCWARRVRSFDTVNNVGHVFFHIFLIRWRRISELIQGHQRFLLQIFSGLLLNIDSIWVGFRWLQYLSIFRYGNNVSTVYSIQFIYVIYTYAWRQSMTSEHREGCSTSVVQANSIQLFQCHRQYRIWFESWELYAK